MYPYPYSCYHANRFYHHQTSPYHHYRQYPPVDETTFIQSVETIQIIARDASTILNKLSDRTFAHQLMTAAQQGNQNEVNRLMNSIGISSQVNTSFTPTGIELKLQNSTANGQCCTLTMFLKWGN
ncbi:hypothetical protein [Bacillus sp. B15-48]|uniref:hypothetical protein n=1 Tax=Bacillus sp. B15-48 TaxID=1548601 RepID=UPI0019401D5A|nr:hypothetical protein [Bacillus sp. B15-48]MBM4760982.1 hypothetical protein [Bacillus sp. B15-48]